MRLTKLDVFSVALDFVSLSFETKFELLKGLKTIDEEDFYLSEEQLENKIWAEANKDLGNFIKFVELLDKKRLIV